MIATLSGTRILVADDQPDAARTFCSPLRAAEPRSSMSPTVKQRGMRLVPSHSTWS